MTRTEKIVRAVVWTVVILVAVSIVAAGVLFLIYAKALGQIGYG